MWSPQASRLGVLTTVAACALAVTACNKSTKGKSAAAIWVDSPTSGVKSGSTLTFDDLGVKFETPDTLYVYRNCGEASHTPDGSTKWIPIVTCRSGDGEDFAFGEESEEDGEDFDPFAAEENESISGAEGIDLTFFVTHKTRPLDERSVTWFENKYKQAGLVVDEISYQSDYQKKTGIYTRLHVIDGDTGNPAREIIQFMFPRKDVVFIARMEYPFGDTRSVDKDWQYILWNFDWSASGGASSAEPEPAEE